MNFSEFCSTWEVCPKDTINQVEISENQDPRVSHNSLVPSLQFSGISKSCKKKVLLEDNKSSQRRSLRRKKQNLGNQIDEVKESKNHQSNFYTLHVSDQKRETFPYRSPENYQRHPNFPKIQEYQPPIQDLTKEAQPSLKIHSPIIIVKNKNFIKDRISQNLDCRKNMQPLFKSFHNSAGQSWLKNNENKPASVTIDANKKTLFQETSGDLFTVSDQFEDLDQIEIPKKTIRFRKAQTIEESEQSSTTSEVIKKYKNLQLSHLVSRESLKYDRSPKKGRSPLKKLTKKKQTLFEI